MYPKPKIIKRLCGLIHLQDSNVNSKTQAINFFMLKIFSECHRKIPFKEFNTKFGNKNREVCLFSITECFPKLSESSPEFQGHLFLIHNLSELELTRFAVSGKGLGVPGGPCRLGSQGRMV